jgi:hypothetical protein
VGRALPRSGDRARFALVEVVHAIGWPKACQITQTGPNRWAIPVSIEALIAAADRLYPDWPETGQIEFVDVSD